MRTRLRIACLLALVAPGLWPSAAAAQIFAKGARTEFISGFGIRAFTSFHRLGTLLDDGEEVANPAGRRVLVRTTPIVIVHGLRQGLSAIGVFPLVDKSVDLDAPDRPGTSSGVGLGDATFLLKWRLLKKDRGRGTFQLAAELGIKVPTGSTSLRDRDGGLLPRGLQRGTGSWDPTGDLVMTFVPRSGRWIFGADLGFTATTDADGFNLGDRLAYDGVVKYRLRPNRYPGRDLFLMVELNGRQQGGARAGGVKLDDTGGHVLYVSPGLQYLLRRNLILEGGVQLPVLRDVRGTQLVSDYNVLLGIRYIILP